MINAPGVVSPMAFMDFSKMRGGSGEQEAFGKAAENFEKINVVSGVDTIGVQIPAYRGGAIGGRVMYDDGDAAIGVKVEILRKADGKFLPVIANFSAIFSMIGGGGGGFQTDDRGVYRFSGLPAGEYVIKVTENTSHGDGGGGRRYYDPFEEIFSGSGNSFLTMFYPDAPDLKSAQMINVVLGQEIAEINVTLPSRNLYKLEGKIVSRKDKTPVKATVKIKRDGDENIASIFGEARREQSSVTDEGGNWKFKELPKGNYKIIVEPIQSESDYRMATGDYSNANIAVQRNPSPQKPKLAKKSQEIKIEDADQTNVVVELGSGATISGTISVENSREMPNIVQLAAMSVDGDLESVKESVMNNYVVSGTNKAKTADYDFKLENVSEGKTVFYVHPDENYYVKSVKSGSIDLLADVFDLKEGDDQFTNVQIVLGKDVGTVKGKVIDGGGSNSSGAPLKNAEITFIPVEASRRKTSTFIKTVKTDANGEFEIKLAPMEYAAVFIEEVPDGISRRSEDWEKWLSGIVSAGQKVTVEAGKTEKMTIRKIKR